MHTNLPSLSDVRKILMSEKGQGFATTEIKLKNRTGVPAVLKAKVRHRSPIEYYSIKDIQKAIP